MASGKWISELRAETPTVDAARRVLGLRLQSLRDAVGCALHERDEELENVHQLRVASRQASAALDVFSVCFEKKACRSTAKTLRKLRRAAGEARDWDVFILKFARQLQPASRDDAPALDLLCGHALAHRIPAQQRL